MGKVPAGSITAIRSLHGEDFELCKVDITNSELPQGNQRRYRSLTPCFAISIHKCPEVHSTVQLRHISIQVSKSSSQLKLQL